MPAFRSELLSFPAGKNDDQVDARGLIGQVLDCMTAGNALQKPPEKMRYMNEMTMDEVWELARPTRRHEDLAGEGCPAGKTPAGQRHTSLNGSGDIAV
jgi:hypothetical protein